MDRNQLIGLIMMLVFITIYFQFFAPEPPEPTDPSAMTAGDTIIVRNDSLAAAEPTTTLSDSAKAKLNEMKYIFPMR